MKESKIVTSVCNYLQLLENQGKLCFIRNNSGALKIGNRFIRFGKKGSPDIVLFLPKYVILLEIKNDKGTQSENQVEFQKRIEKLGYFYVIARSLDDVLSLLQDYNI